MKYIIIKILNTLSKKILDKYNPVVIGIAGSVGKSSVRKAVYELLEGKYKVAFNKDYYKTEIGIPLAIIGAKSGGRSIIKWLEIIFRALKMVIKKVEYPDILILEMGVERPNDMKKMLGVVKPNIGILTNIEKISSHTKYFTKEKSLFLKSLKKKDLAILNCDDDIINDLSKNIRPEVMSYGFNDDSVVKAGEIFSRDKKMSFKISYEGTFVPFRLSSSLGKKQIYAVLAASAIGIHFGYNLVEISEKLSNHNSLSEKKCKAI